MKLMRKSFIALALAASLAACGTTEGLLAGAGVAGGLLSSLTSTPDYTKYADTCRQIVADNRAAAEVEGETLRLLAKDKETKGQVLLYMAMKPRPSAAAQCALALPKGFLQTLAESGNLLNFVATIYSENRADSRAQRQLQVSKELGLANLEHQQEMQQLENAFIGQLAGNANAAFQSGAEAARQPAPAAE